MPKTKYLEGAHIEWSDDLVRGHYEGEKGQNSIITLVLQMQPLTKLRQACKSATTASKIPNIDWSSFVALSHKNINAHSQQRKTVKVPVQSNDDLKTRIKWCQMGSNAFQGHLRGHDLEMEKKNGH